MGVLICGSHIATMYLWTTLAILNTLNAHSGYHFPFFPSPESHDYHHLKFNQCFGVLGILDYLHGTDIQFRESKAYQRHVLSVSTTPLRETFPDDDSSKLLEKEKLIDEN
jgi:methylsterol monooxygenase